MVNLEILNPVAKLSTQEVTLAPRLGDLSGKTIGLLWNAKPSGDVINQFTAELLADKFKDVCFKNYIGSVNVVGVVRHATAEDVDMIANECDAVIGSLADWGSCTSWLVHDIIELEKRGVPAVGWVVAGFLDDAKMSAKVSGSKSTALAVLARETSVEPTEGVHELVTSSIDQVIDGLTKPVTAFEAEEVFPSEVLTIEGDDLLDATEKMNLKFLSEGWSDGFPLVPPTRKAVKRMLTGTRLGQDQVIAVLGPGNGIGTVEKIAINAIMAGCRPEHMPLLVTAVRCISDPVLELRGRVLSAGAQGPFILVNGPIAKRLNINSKLGALDPGSCSYANIVIGRALSLIILNIAHGYTGTGSMSTIGNPMNYSLCVAENEEDSPWEPYHVEKGYDKDTSTVTIVFVRGGTTYADLTHNTAEGIARGQSWVASRPNNTTGLWLMNAKTQIIFLVNPSNARVLAREGWDKKTLRQYLYDHAKLPFEVLMFGKEPSIVNKEFPQLTTLLEDHPEVPLPIVGSPDCYQIAVVGGFGPASSYFEGYVEAVTLPIEEWEFMNLVLERHWF